MNRWGERDDADAQAAGQTRERLFRALAEPARLAILTHLVLGEHRVADLTEHTGLAQSTTSAHLAVLRECGLVTLRTDGRSSMYSLSAPAELAALLAAADAVSVATGALPGPVARVPSESPGRRPATLAGDPR
ncbi:MAG: metalloregulator ArsR/SmtB family transcription factor [Propionicimonas sp.]|uniref:ArsR/SmtB family transcription factor n=1 Tax=Propionicimonas sp. TaxID=1955623 RepID=UPI003D130ED8